MVLKVKKSLHQKITRKLVLIGGLVAISLLVGVLELTNTTHVFHKRKTISGIIPSTSNPSQSPSPSVTTDKVAGSDTPPASSGASAAASPKADTAISGAQGPLLEPYGTFVSNHSPSLSDTNGAPSGEQSVCITSAGASCYITFKRLGIVKTLETKIADSKGSVYWDWDVNKAGFSAGSWQITATATANGQTKSVNDTLDLKVTP